MKPPTHGTCLLTGDYGKFAKSHLIPRAFTKPAEPGARLNQAGHGLPVTRHSDSWYDRQIVTDAGESILGGIDDAGIKELRRLRLVWSGWGPMTELGADHVLEPGTPYGFRFIVGHDVKALRLFCLSLLWRAAVTTRREFAQVTLPADNVERIRDLIVSGDPGPDDFHAVEFIQLSTLGHPHNNSPAAFAKDIPASFGTPGWSVPIFRFYLDGLILHIHQRESLVGPATKLGPLILGRAPDLMVQTIVYAQSAQAAHLAEIVALSVSSDRPYPQRPVKP